MTKMGHRPGHGLGREEQGRRRAIESDGNIGKLGLGYQLTNANKPSQKWKLSNHFIQGPTEGATPGESLGHQPEDHPSHALQSSPLSTVNLEEEEIDYGLALMLHTPDEGGSHSFSSTSALEALQNSHFIPVNDPQDAQCLMLSVIDRQKKKTPKLQHGIALCPWKSPDFIKETPSLKGSSSLLQ